MTRFEKVLGELVTEVGAVSVTHFKESFALQEFNETPSVPWAQRKRETKRSRGKKVLTGIGRLRRSIRVTGKGKDYVTIGTDVPYAKIHNEGGTIENPGGERVLNFKRKKNGSIRFSRKRSAKFSQKVTKGPHQVTMPKRQFMGYSRKLESKLEAIIEKRLYEALLKDLNS